MAHQVTTKTKEYLRTMSPTWWLEKPNYTKFMLRDATSIFIAAYCIFLMVLMYRAGQDAESFRSFMTSLTSPLSIILHLIALVFAVYHSVTFFNLTPRVIVLYQGEDRVHDAVVALAHYALWIVVSLAVILIALFV